MKMVNWNKVKKITGIAIGIAGFVVMMISIFRGGSQITPRLKSKSGSSNVGSGSIWFVGSGQTKKPGSWSSGRHK